LIKKIIPKFLLSFYHYCLALIGAFFYGFPSKKLVVIGVTGTSGKSTVVELSSLILETAGFKVASLSSFKFKIKDKEWENKLKMTMPGRMKIQKFFDQAIKTGCEYAVLEVTSEGIKQFRHKFIDFKVAVFTNLSPEHIESHGGFEKYRAAKGEFFRAAKKIHIINRDDENSDYFWKIPAEKKIGYSLKEIGLLPRDFKLLGQFNLYNALAAIKVGLSQGVSLEICQKALEKIKQIPGRMEIVIKEPFKVIVDYAHTPAALEQVYKTLKDRPMVCVLGSCGGGRDKWKRPVMGKIAAQYCDKAIITNEDPYNEEPIEIINQVAGDTKAEKILDRKEAIKKALGLANPGDIVIITGKGSEPWMCVKNNKKIPWSDKKIVLDLLKGSNKIEI
jgi:UDP-N-acetylmuramoyl-L-alanyl-D-glutamate--2,6-diaminopimelate ligase